MDYIDILSKEKVSITYLKEEDKFALYYPGPNEKFGQQCFKFEYYDMIFSINKLRDEIWANRSKFYKKKEGRGRLLADILSGMFGYRCNDCLIVIFDRFCISKTMLDKCYTLRKKKGGVRKIELKMREK